MQANIIDDKLSDEDAKPKVSLTIDDLEPNEREVDDLVDADEEEEEEEEEEEDNNYIEMYF